MAFYLGIDFGTSGARAIVIDIDANILTQATVNFPAATVNKWTEIWQETLFTLLAKIPQAIRTEIQAIAINGTSATVLICDAEGSPLDEPIFYHDSRGKDVLERLQTIVPPHHVTLSATSSLAKLLWWSQQPTFALAKYFLHQADWLAFLLHDRLGISDYHNALKLGYDVEKLTYPHWLENLSFRSLLPQVLAPGTPVAPVTRKIAERFNLPSSCLVCTGTTDSIAAFIASGANQPGEAVTSLGSTLVLKLLSHTRVEDSRYGIYSHRYGQNLWLTGGASNTGGAVLRHFFSDAELINLSQKINPQQASNLDYYPLLQPGDRFPVNNPHLVPQLEPRPEQPEAFLHGLLESMARIEARGYQLLQQLGANSLTKVYTAGGGAKNDTWTKIRQRHLPVPVVASVNTEAAYGSALLAKGLLRQSEIF